ncbi:MAG: nuclear transport factor 2 family protein [Myxococcota bacterium]
MSASEIGKKLVELCKAGKNAEAIATLYADDIVSVEAGAPPGQSPESRGLAAVQGKSEWWRANHTVHSATCEGPWPHGDRFAVRFTYDITRHANGQRVQMDEIGLFTVAGDKIVREEFFYAM